jgi:hypothetical protein
MVAITKGCERPTALEKKKKKKRNATAMQRLIQQNPGPRAMHFDIPKRYKNETIA